MSERAPHEAMTSFAAVVDDAREALSVASLSPGHGALAHRLPLVASLAVVTLGASLVGALMLGAEPISLVRAWSDPASLDRVILVEARLPRVVLGALAGGGLAAAGAAFQALLRNPLAEPYVLGVSGGSALGASLAIALGLRATTIVGASLLPFAALVGGLGATALVYAIARQSRGGTALLLAGVIVNSVSGAMITLLKSLVSAARAQQLLFWLVGFLDAPAPATLAAVAAGTLLGTAVLWADAGRLHLLALGDDAATQVGVDVPALERRIFIACSLLVGAIVSATGLIGFVGLVVPQALRRLLTRHDPRSLIPLSFVLGAALLVVCDALARWLFRWLGTEPPVGAITALLGGPVFLWLLARPRR